MKKVQENLLEYRRTKKLLEKPEKNPSASEKAIYKQVFLAESVDDTTIATTSRTPSQTQPLNFLDIWAIDCLNFYPMRKWREFSVRYPLQCWVTTGCIWLTGQLVFATHEFGCVYFILSLFLLMLLNLGVRKEGKHLPILYLTPIVNDCWDR